MKAMLRRWAWAGLDRLYRINPVLEIQLLYRIRFGKRLELKAPVTYQEKLQWLKLYYRDERMPRCADKFHARGYIREMGLGQYLPRLLWQGFDPECIPWDSLPKAFVVKVSSGSGENLICRDKDSFDRDGAVQKLRRWLGKPYHPAYGEWMYNVLPGRIVIEEFLSDGIHPVPEDYKFFCFNGLDGAAGCIAVDMARFSEHRRNVYDSQWRLIPDVHLSYPMDSQVQIPRPGCLEQMLQAAQTLAKPFPHVRVDFYVIGDRFYIGEMTFFTGAGFNRIAPEAFARQLGDWIVLPPKEG